MKDDAKKRRLGEAGCIPEGRRSGVATELWFPQNAVQAKSVFTVHSPNKNGLRAAAGSSPRSSQALQPVCAEWA
jgi:hypothetical protein